MKFIISSESLLKNLQVLGSILNNNNTLPILDCFLFEIENKELFVTSSDLETSLTSNILRDKGIEATLKLAESNNAKVVVVGSGDDGLPLILGNN